MATQLFKKGDRVRLINDHSYSGIVTKVKYIPKRGLISGDYQWLWLNNSNTPVGVTSENFELEPSQITDREKAMEWWNKCTPHICVCLVDNSIFKGRHWSSLTGREIEQIWRKEVQPQNVFKRELLTQEPRIDFEMLKKILDKESCYGEVKVDDRELDNLKLFITKLSQSSSFAHKAHKELQKLMR